MRKILSSLSTQTPLSTKNLQISQSQYTSTPNTPQSTSSENSPIQNIFSKASDSRTNQSNDLTEPVETFYSKFRESLADIEDSIVQSLDSLVEKELFIEASVVSSVALAVLFFAVGSKS